MLSLCKSLVLLATAYNKAYNKMGAVRIQALMLSLSFAKTLYSKFFGATKLKFKYNAKAWSSLTWCALKNHLVILRPLACITPNQRTYERKI